ncbi:MAG: hypothetical protein MZV64_17295 [Ignavibacteriales bacterium]|nr:hypothetical protein [Ignavibacteriales bacterium]
MPSTRAVAPTSSLRRFSLRLLPGRRFEEPNPPLAGLADPHCSRLCRLRVFPQQTARSLAAALHHHRSGPGRHADRGCYLRPQRRSPHHHEVRARYIVPLP